MCSPVSMLVAPFLSLLPTSLAATGKSVNHFDLKGMRRNVETRYRIVDSETQASIERIRHSAFRPFDEATSDRVNYSQGHPWEQPRRRSLASAESQPIRIHFYTKPLEAARGESDEKDKRLDVLESKVLPEIANVWSRALSVAPADGVRVRKDACAGRFDADSDFYVPDVDLVIAVDTDVSAKLGCIEGGESGALALAFPCAADQWDRPIIGFINFCMEVALVNAVDDGQISEEEIQKMISLGAHEVGHVLGLSGDFVKYFRDLDTGEPRTERPFRLVNTTCADGSVREVAGTSADSLTSGVSISGARFYEITTPRVTTVVRNQFNCPSLKGARLENQPTSATSCFGGHFDERYFFTELMGAIFGQFANALSPLTLAFFEDSGWYVANYSSATISSFGYGAGCEFVNDDCIKDGEVPDYSKGFFCNQKISLGKLGLVPTAITCDPSRTHKAVCDFADRNDFPGMVSGDGSVPEPFQYFPGDETAGPVVMQLADYCPIPLINYMDCEDSSISEEGEYFGEASRCYDITDGSEAFAMCFKTACNAEQKKIEVDVGSETIVCDFDGQVHDLGFSQMECPRFAVICPHLACPGNCAGRGVCDWDAEGGPRCECNDETDTSPGCDGFTETVSSTISERTTTAPKEKPTRRPTEVPESASTESPDPSALSNVSFEESLLPSGLPSFSPVPNQTTALNITLAPENLPSSSPTSSFRSIISDQPSLAPAGNSIITLFPTTEEESVNDGPIVFLPPQRSTAKSLLGTKASILSICLLSLSLLYHAGI